MSTGPLAVKVDPYLAQDDGEGADKIVRAIEQLAGKLTAEAPNVTVEAAKVNIPESNVTVHIDSAKEWDVKVTERDEYGRILRMKFKAVE